MLIFLLECQCESQLLCFQSSTPLRYLERQQKTGQILGPLLPTWEIQMELHSPGFGLARPNVASIGQVNQQMKDIRFSIFPSIPSSLLICLSNEQIHKSLLTKEKKSKLYGLQLERILKEIMCFFPSKMPPNYTLRVVRTYKSRADSVAILLYNNQITVKNAQMMKNIPLKSSVPP